MPNVPCKGPDCPFCKTMGPPKEKLIVAEIGKDKRPTGRQITFSAAMSKAIKEKLALLKPSR